MEPSSAGANSIAGDRYFRPGHREKVVDPQIVHICDSLSSVNDQVGVEQLRGMIGSGPRSRLIALGIDLDPLLGLPVEDVDGVKPLLVGPTSSEKDEPVVVLIVVHGAVRTMRGDVSGCGDFVPLHGDGVEGPEIIHVIGI